MWHKIGHIEIELGHSNIAVVFKRIRKHGSKKTKNITEEEKEKCKVHFEGEGVFLLLKNLHVM